MTRLPHLPTATRFDTVRAGLVVFVASCATLVLELVASRVLAPFVGASLHTWTSIIGVVLLGISLGAWAGGRLADRGVWTRRLPALLALGALAALAPLAVTATLGDGTALRAIPLLPRTLLLTLAAFFPASFVLSTVTPLALRRLLGEVERAGRLAGLLYALGTVGGLAGNFLTGLVLLAYFSTQTIVLGVSGALALCALLLLPGAGSPAAPTSTPADSGADEPTANAPAHPLELRGNLIFGCVLVAAASFATLLIEVGASRLIAPTWGASLISWTSVIGVVLVGMAAGNSLGGWLADRFPRQETLALCLGVAALACLSILVTNRGITGETNGSLARAIVLHGARVFLLPVTALGTLSPLVLRLTLTGVSSAGRTVGLLYAWSTAGALLGSFLTGWWLIARFGVYTLLFGACIALLVLAALVGRVWLHRRQFALVSLAFVTAAAAWSLGFARSPCTQETDYFCIQTYVTTLAGRELKVMRLDMLVHTLTDLKDPSWLGYPHDYIQSEFMREVETRTPNPRVLVVGGGGYVFPRWIEHFIPQATVDVLEIDPAVSRLALEKFGLRPDTRINTFNLDGRLFITERAEKGAYDLVVQDVFNDLSVPFHLMTREYDAAVKAVLRPGGIYMLSVIDEIPHGGLLRASVRTMQAVFPHVELLHDVKTGGTGQTIYVIAGSDQPMDVERVQRLVREHGIEQPVTAALSKEALDAYLAAGPAPVLTDAWAPVDNLLVELFLLREEVAKKRTAQPK